MGTRKRGKNDPVNHPAHYTFGRFEVIDVIEDWNLGFHEASAVKYIARAGKKNPKKTIEDYSKAVWYLQRKINQLKRRMPCVRAATGKRS